MASKRASTTKCHKKPGEYCRVHGYATSGNNSSLPATNSQVVSASPSHDNVVAGNPVTIQPPDEVMKRVLSISEASDEYIQRVRIHFDNGYSASIIQGKNTQSDADTYEVAVLDEDGHITYDTPVTSDVLGYQDKEEVMQTLGSISSLPSVQPEIENRKKFSLPLAASLKRIDGIEDIN